MAEVLTAQLQLNVSAFTSALTQAGQRVQQFAADVTAKLSQATSSLASNTSGAQANQQATNQLAAAYLAMAQAIQTQTQGYVQAQAATLAYRQEQDKLRQAAREAAAEARAAAQATASWMQALSVAGGLGIATSIGAMVSGLKNMVIESTQLAIKMQSLEQTFRALTGSSAKASQELAFIRRVATDTGTDFLTLANAFKNFESAARGTSLEGTKARGVFEGLATASRVMGLSSEQTAHALLALEQMVSKGRVSMEELRRQLGNALPGGFQIAARAMGATTEELNKMVKEGLNAEEFVVRFGAQLKKEFGPGLAEAAKTAAATFARLGNEVQSLAVTVGKSILTILTPIASFVEKTLRAVREANEAGKSRVEGRLSATLAGAGLTDADLTQSQRERLLAFEAKAQQGIAARMPTGIAAGAAATAEVTRILDEIKASKAAALAAAADVASEETLFGAEPRGKTFVQEGKAIIGIIHGAKDELGNLASANKTFPSLIAGKEGELVAVRDQIREVEKAIAEVVAITNTKKLKGQTPGDALQEVDDLKRLHAGMVKHEQQLEKTIEKEKELERERDAATKKRETAIANATEPKEFQYLAEKISAVSKAMEEPGIQPGRFQELAATLNELRESQAKLAGSMDPLKNAMVQGLDEIAHAEEETGKESAALVKKLQTDFKAAQDILDQGLAGDRFDRRIERIKQKYAELAETLGPQAMADIARAQQNEIATVMEEVTRKTESELKKQQKAWDELARDIQRTLSDAFENVLAGTFSVWDGIKRGFIKLLADLAAAALMQTIIIPIAAGFLGGGGGLASSLLGAGGSGGMGGSGGGAEGIAGASGGGSTLGGALGIASSGYSMYSGLSGHSLLGSTGILGGLMGTELGELGVSGSGYIGGSAGSFGGLSGTTVGTVASGIGVGIAAGQIFSKLNAMMGLHGTGNKVLSGAGGGAIAGTMIMPGIGTAIGAAVGALGGYIASLFGGKNKPQPLYDPTAVQAGQVAYDPLQGLHMIATMGITQDIHRDVGGLKGWQATVKTINDGLADMAQQVVGQFQGIAPELQQALVDPLNTAFGQIAAQISGLKITGETVEEFTTNLQEMMGTTLPGYFNDAMASVVAKLQATVKKIEPVFNAFTQVIETLQKDIDAIHGQQLAMHNTLQAARQGLMSTLQSPAEAFMAAQGQYGRARDAFSGGNAQQRILLAPALAQAAQQLLSMSKSEDVLGQDMPLVKNLQTSLLADLDMLQVQTDTAFDSMTAVLQKQVDAAEAQKKALIGGLANPASLDQVIAGSLDALASIQNAIAANAGEGDPLVQAQVALLGGLNQIGTAQLQILTDISQKLGGGVGSFADGSTYIPYSQMAYIHAGERVVPAGDTYGGNTINLSVNVTGEATTQGASQIADAVIREIEKRGGRYGTTSIQVKR